MDECEEYIEVETEDDYDIDYDAMDYCVFGLTATVIILILWKILFKKGKFKICRDGIEFETDNNKE